MHFELNNLFKNLGDFFFKLFYLFVKYFFEYFRKKWEQKLKVCDDENFRQRSPQSAVTCFFCLFLFFESGFSFMDTDDSQDSGEREGAIFYSTLPLSPIHEHPDIYLQLCIWDDYHIFLIAPLIFTRLLLNKIYHLSELPFVWLMMRC